jgi:hypothetical protein
MANFTLAVGGQTFDLTSFSPQDLMPIANDLAFIVSGALEQFLDSPLSQIDSPHNSASLSYGSAQQSWQPSGGPVTFTLSGSVAATVTVVNAGSIFGQDSSGNDVVYYDGFVDPQPIDTFTVPAGFAFIATQLNFGISGSLAASANFDALGITADASGNATYAITHYKAFPVTAILRDALPQALAQFVLPLHSATAGNLADQDVLAYSFDGTLQVGFGLNYGITGSLAGYSANIGLPLAEVNKIIAVSASAKPSYTVGATFAVQFPWSRTFQCIVQRADNSTGDTATVHIFQQSESQRNINVSAGVLTESANAAASANLDSSKLSSLIKEKLFGTGTPPPGFNAALAAGVGELQKYVGDVNSYAQKLLAKLPSGETGISAVINGLDQRTSCFQYVFNVSDANFADAWNLAMGGDFVGSFRFPTAVQLAAGSGFDQYHQRSTSVSLEIFGYTLGNDVSTFYSDVTITYAGAGRFQFSSKEGRSCSTSSLSAQSSTDLYFTATADSNQALDASDVVVQFHGVLTANQNPQVVLGFADLIGALPCADSAAIAAQLAQQYSGSDIGPVAIHVTFAPSAYKKITSTPFTAGKPVDQQYQTADKNNWNAYTSATDVLRRLDPPANQLSMQVGAVYEDYTSWAYFNQTLMKGGTPPPNRRLTNVPGQITEEACDNIMGANALSTYGFSLRLYELAGQEFMNLCDDLRPIVADQSGNPVGWATIMNDVGAASADLDPWFGAVTILALAKLCGTTFKISPTWGVTTAAININVE